MLRKCFHCLFCRLLNQNLQDLEEFQLQHVHGIVKVNALQVELEMVLSRY